MDGDIIPQLLSTLAAAQSEAAVRGSTVRTPDVRALSSRFYRETRHAEKTQIFAYCEELLFTGDSDARIVAFDWAFRVRNDYVDSDFIRFERWLYEYVDGWGSCDDFCTHAFGALIYRFTHLFPEVKDWTLSENRWLRRAAAVVLVYAVRRQTLFNEAFTTADELLLDEDDLVQKGYGWLLKEVSNHAPEAVFEYVMNRKESMPRTSLRYAVEKLDPDLRKRAMVR